MMMRLKAMAGPTSHWIGALMSAWTVSMKYRVPPSG